MRYRTLFFLLCACAIFASGAQAKSNLYVYSDDDLLHLSTSCPKVGGQPHGMPPTMSEQYNKLLLDHGLDPALFMMINFAVQAFPDGCNVYISQFIERSKTAPVPDPHLSPQPQNRPT